MPRLLNICLKSTGYTALFALATVLAAVIIFLVRLWFMPVDITRLVHFIEPHLPNKTGIERTIGRVTLSWHGRLELIGHQVTLRQSNSMADPLNIERIRLVLENRHLIVGQIRPKHIEITGLNLNVFKENNTLHIAGVSLPLPQQNKAVEGAPVQAPPFDLLTFLNTMQPSPYWEPLRTVRLNGVNITFTDADKTQTWRLNKTQINFSKYRNLGEKFTLAAEAASNQNSEETLGLWLSLSHNPGANQVEATVRLINANTQLLQPYLPEKLSSALQASGSVEVTVPIFSNYKLGALRIATELENVSIYPQVAYTSPLRFNTLKADIRVDKLPTGHTLWIDRVEAEDMLGVKLFLAGHIAELPNTPKLDLLATAADTEILKILHYIPDQYLGETRGWLLERIGEGRLKNTTIRFAGGPEHISDGCGKTCGLTIDMDVENASIQFLEKLPPAKNLHGHFTLKQDRFMVTTTQALLSKQVGQAVTVTVDGLYQDVYGDLTVEGEMSGPIQDGLELLYAQMEETFFPPAKGIHNTSFIAKAPMGTDITFDNLKITGSSKLANAQMPVPGAEDVLMTLPTGTLTIGQGKIHLAGTGTLNDTPVELEVTDAVETMGQYPKVNLAGTFNTAHIAPQLQNAGIAISGTAPFTLKLNIQPGDIFNFNLTSVLDDASLNWPVGDWNKQPQTPLNLALDGVWNQAKGRITFNQFTAKGEGVNINGALNWEPDTTKRSVELKPFNLGDHDWALSLKKEQLSLKGKTLDLDKIKAWKPSGNKTDLSWLKGVLINLEAVTMPGGILSDVSIAGKSSTKVWNEFSAFASLPSGTPLAVSLDVSPTLRTLKLSSPDGGEALRVLGISTKVENGTLTVAATLPPNTLYPVTGSATLLNFQLRKQPLLTELLASLSLEQLLSEKKGILFEQLHIPFTATAEQITVNNTSMTGPALALKLGGTYNRIYNKGLDLKGQVVPTAGFNRAISKIPLVGNVLTGSQEGLLAADFNVTGPLTEPNLSVNPLSVLTPGLLKDLFHIIGEGPTAPASSMPESQKGSSNETAQ